MTEHKTIHSASPIGTHPSFAASGLYEYACECGNTVQYTEHIGEEYRRNGTVTGIHDIGVNEDLCLDCAREADLLDAMCDECGVVLTPKELERNRIENIRESGNSFWCDLCCEDDE